MAHAEKPQQNPKLGQNSSLDTPPPHDNPQNIKTTVDNIADKEKAPCHQPPPDLFSINKTFKRGRMPRSPNWAVPWSDLMMTMFILFVVLYAYQTSKKEFLSPEGLGGQGQASLNASIMESPGRGLGDAAGPTEGFIEKMYDLSKQTLADEKLQEFASVELVADQTVRIILTGDLLFDSGQTILKEKAKQSLTKVANILRQTQYAINVVGHTDNVPIHTDRFPSNWDLSAIRASSVAQYLINQMKIPAKQFYVSGHSHYVPRQTNQTEKGRAANRRVEIILSHEKPRATPTAAKNSTQKATREP